MFFSLLISQTEFACDILYSYMFTYSSMLKTTPNTLVKVIFLRKYWWPDIRIGSELEKSWIWASLVWTDLHYDCSTCYSSVGHQRAFSTNIFVLAHITEQWQSSISCCALAKKQQSIFFKITNWVFVFCFVLFLLVGDEW